MKEYIYRIIIVTTLVLLSIVTLFANSIETTHHNLCFDDFTLYISDANELTIIANSSSSPYAIQMEHSVPSIAIAMAIDGDLQYDSHTLTISKTFIAENVTLSPDLEHQIFVKNNEYLSDLRDYNFQKHCVYMGETGWSDLRILNFQLTPFIYDINDKSLYFINSIDLEVSLNNRSRDGEYYTNPPNYECLKSLVINPIAIDSISRKSQSAQKAIQAKTTEGRYDYLDYIIITSNTLKNSFTKLINWKREKGIYADVVTVEEIMHYSDHSDTTLAIKEFIYGQYAYNGLKYVLLGGDASIVPVRYCHTNVSKESTSPSDIYYGCFGGNFKWDANNNGVYGEITDNINLSPSVYVTRLPLNTSSQFEACINKIIAYEKEPIYCNNILMAGNIMFNYPVSQHSDAEKWSDIIYDNHIKPYWNGIRSKFFDTCSDFDYTLFDNKNLQQSFSKGFSFVDIISHGDHWEWRTQGDYYNTGDALNLKNKVHTIITTSACSTSKFDVTIYGQCLGTSFMRNPDNGVIGYLGCLRESWFEFTNPYLSSSLWYDAQFYTNLFDSRTKSSSFGELVALTKFNGSYYCYEDEADITDNSIPHWGYKYFRAVQYGLNPFGDPEMPIFTEAPHSFNLIDLSYYNHNLYLNTRVSDCRICLMSSDDNGSKLYQVSSDTDSYSFPVTSYPISLCMTKRNYIPRSLSCKSVQNITIDTDTHINGSILLIGSDVDPYSQRGNVVINSGKLV